MINVFELKIGDKVRYDIPDTETDERLRKLNGRVFEVTNIMHVYHSTTFDAVLKFLVKEVNGSEEGALSGKTYQYLTLVED